MPHPALGGGRAVLSGAPWRSGAAARPAGSRLPRLQLLATGESWRFNRAGRRGGERAGQGPSERTNAEALAFALEAGLGLALQPDFLAYEAVRDGRLRIVLADWSPPPSALTLVTPPGGPRPARVEVLLAFLTRRFRAGSAPWSAPP
ncbi:MAG: LysR substrate-binding domain-containing protein [Caulobacteraceae bacterium]